MTNPDKAIEALGLQLPPPPSPAGFYQPVVVTGHLAFLSGQLSKSTSGKMMEGKVGKELSLEQGQEAAKLSALNLLSVLKHQIGFSKVARIVKMTGYVQADPGFYRIPEVMNAASELFAKVFGDQGTHARAAVGVASLPLNAAVEIELIVELA